MNGQSVGTPPVATSSGTFPRRVALGRTSRMVARVGLGSSFGLSAADVEYAYHEHGINYLYWGSVRRPGFGLGIQHLARQHRDDLVVVLQSYVRVASLLKLGVHVGLKRLQLDHADVLLFGLYNRRPSQRLIDAALELREKGLIRHLAISAHNRPSFQGYLSEGQFDVLHVRYNAAHRGAEREVFPYLPAERRPGMVAFTALRWGSLISPRAALPGEAVPTATDCYRFALSHRAVDVVISGAANRSHLDQAAQALTLGPLDVQELAWMRRIGDRVHADGGRP